MNDSVRISDVRFVSGPPTDVRGGLIGWVSCVVNGTIHLDGISLRRTLNGRLTLSFPGRRDRAGRRHYYVRPLNERSRRDIEHQVLRALGRLEEDAPRWCPTRTSPR